MISPVHAAVSDLLAKKERDYLTTTQVRNGLGTAILKSVNLKKKSSGSEVVKQLGPHLGDNLRIYKSGQRSFIGLTLSLEEMILGKIRKKPGQSLAVIGKDLPMLKKDYIACLNSLLAKGAVKCALNQSYKVMLSLPDRVDIVDGVDKVDPVETRDSVETKDRNPELINTEDDRILFKTAFDHIGKGRNFVQIYQLREELQWSRERFDRLLNTLRREYRIQLQGGDPSQLTASQVQDSFVDEKGRLRLTISWREQSS